MCQITKPLLERKRRARINRCLDELKDLMVDALEVRILTFFFFDNSLANSARLFNTRINNKCYNSKIKLRNINISHVIFICLQTSMSKYLTH